MLSNMNMRKPANSDAIAADAEAMGFTMSCDLETASLLRTLAGTFKNGKLLELGTGAGLSTSWILDGMDSSSSLWTVERDGNIQSIAKKHLSLDTRVHFFTLEGEDFIKALREKINNSILFLPTLGLESFTF